LARLNTVGGGLPLARLSIRWEVGYLWPDCQYGGRWATFGQTQYDGRWATFGQTLNTVGGGLPLAGLSIRREVGYLWPDPQYGGRWATFGQTLNTAGGGLPLARPSFASAVSEKFPSLAVSPFSTDKSLSDIVIHCHWPWVLASSVSLCTAHHQGLCLPFGICFVLLAKPLAVLTP
jgi:hypothetical protein